MEKTDENVKEVCKKLSEVVEIVLNPYVDQKERVEAQVVRKCTKVLRHINLLHSKIP